LAIHRREPYASGAAFGEVGPYERVDGTLSFAVDPAHPANAGGPSGGRAIVDAIQYFGSRDKIHHVHYRNPRGVFPNYVETWIDEGDTDMFAAMRAYRDVGYRFTLCSDHVPKMSDDLAFGLIGRAYNHGYIKAMIQAVNRADCLT
jgi:mannonate dehydratase